MCLNVMTIISQYTKIVKALKKSQYYKKIIFNLPDSGGKCQVGTVFIPVAKTVVSCRNCGYPCAFLYGSRKSGYNLPFQYNLIHISPAPFSLFH